MARKAPGKAHRKGLTFMEVADKFSSEEKAREWIEAQRWPDGPYCPKCGSFNVQSNIAHKTMTHRCRDCTMGKGKSKTMFTVRIGTVMENTRMPYRALAVGIYLFTTNIKDVSSMRLARELGISQKAAWFLLHRLRLAFEAETETALFSGPVEADETYVGGERRNMSKTKRAAMNKSRGPVGKTAVVGAKDRASNKVAARTVPATSSPYTAGFVAEKTKIGATVYTDEAAAYRVLKPWFQHEAVNHTIGEYVNFKTGASTQGIESFWAMLKRVYQGIYHKMSPKHLDRYVAEFAGRHNVREADTIDQMAGVVSGMAEKRLTYAALIADNGLASGARG